MEASCLVFARQLKLILKKMPNELNLDEVIFLVVLSKGPSFYEPVCCSERLFKQMNHLRRLLSMYYPQLYVDLKPINILIFNPIRQGEWAKYDIC
jgi:hypothetical protein